MMILLVQVRGILCAWLYAGGFWCPDTLRRASSTAGNPWKTKQRITSQFDWQTGSGGCKVGILMCLSPLRRRNSGSRMEKSSSSLCTQGTAPPIPPVRFTAQGTALLSSFFPPFSFFHFYFFVGGAASPPSRGASCWSLRLECLWRLREKLFFFFCSTYCTYYLRV